MKQGCILAPVHFIFFTCVLSHAVTDTNDGMYLKYRTDGSLFDLHRLSTKTKIVKKIILEALFADNCTLMAHKESTLQLIVNIFTGSAFLFGLTIILGRTKVLFQPVLLPAARCPSISI